VEEDIILADIDDDAVAISFSDVVLDGLCLLLNIVCALLLLLLLLETAVIGAVM
jgi:hypothetical protein